MPDTELPKSYQGVLDPPTSVAACDLDYAELDVTTNFTFLTGASHPDELVYTAALLGYRAIAITDQNTVAGVVRAWEAAKTPGIKLVIGARLVFTDAPDLLVWPTNRAAYGQLCRLLTLGRRRAPKGECHLQLSDFIQCSDGFHAALDVDTNMQSAERKVEEGFIRYDTDPLHSALCTLHSALTNRLSIIATILHTPDDETHLQNLADLSRQYNIPLVATNAVHYHDPGRRLLQDVLTCVRHGCTLQEAGFKLFPNGERYLKSPAQMHKLFANYPDAIKRTIEIANACTFDLADLKYEYPNEVTPAGSDMKTFLREETYRGANERYPTGIPPKVTALLEKELKFIVGSKYEPYFLTVWDLVRYARSQGILCQGRGSAANSAVCYCLGVTSVDPDKFQLVFERFASSARNEPPDIDIDFEHERREEVIQYIYKKYGRDRAGMTGGLITYRGRSAVRDVGKALGLSLDMIANMADKLDWWHHGALTQDQLQECGIDPLNPTIRHVIELTTEVLGFPRHLSQHVGGLVISMGPLCELVPIENASMEDRTVIQWDKNDIDSVGIFKVDCLALGMLTAISKSLAMINGRHGGTEARRHGGEESDIQRYNSSYGTDDSHTSGSDCLAEGDGINETDLSSHSSNAQRRSVRTDQPNAASGGFGSIEHCRGIRIGESNGVSETSTDRARIAGGTVDPMGTHDGIENASTPSNDSRPDCRNRPSPPRPDPRTTELQTASVAPRPPLLPPPCLRAFVPPCLPLQLHTIPHEDPIVYDMICDADTIGVFQIESRAQMSMLPRLKPREFYDLVIEVAIVRPGPIQGDMVHPYLKRRSQQEPVLYPKPELHEVLHKTLGVPLFQEQAMRMAIVAAGFTPEEADLLRRAMAAWKRSGGINKFETKFIQGMIDNGYEQGFAENCFKQICGFGEYGFPESHAASFAKLVYASCWLKRYHPAAFCASLINSQPMGFYAPAQLVRDAREHGVEVREIDVNFSEWDCTLEERHEGTEAQRPEERGGKEKTPVSEGTPEDPDRAPSPHKSTWGLHGPAIRLGFRQVKGFRKEFAERIASIRNATGPFTTIEDFQQRTHLPVHAIRQLAEADAFHSLDLTRRPALWNTLPLQDEPNPLFSSPSCLRASVPSCLPPTCLPDAPLGQEILTDYNTTGLSLKQHPLSLLREELQKRKIIPASLLKDETKTPHGRWVKVAGLVLVRQRPGTASGVVFITIEDETANANLILWAKTYDQYRPAARHARVLQCDGYVQREGQVVHILAKRLFDLSDLLTGYAMNSRDFR